jgi:hypothetical protein
MVCLATIATLLSISKIAAGDAINYKPDLWTLGESFSKRIDLYSRGESQERPELELTFLSWNLGRLTVAGDFHNLKDSPWHIKGYTITDSFGIAGFYPLATLEVANDVNGPWKTVSLSPSVIRGVEKDVTVLPERARPTRLQPFVIELDPLRRRLAKFMYFRVIIANDRTSQVLAMTDLLPEKDDPFWQRVKEAEEGD